MRLLRNTGIILLTLCCCGLLHAPVATAFEAGAATMDITPPLGTPLSGYGDRMSRGATSVHDPLTARALYLDDGETRLFLVTTDLCVINPELRERVLALAPEMVPKENILLTATHNHNGTGGLAKCLAFRTVSGRYVPEVLEQTASGIAEAMHEAHRQRRRAAIGYDVTTQTVLTRNRRYKDGPIDEQIGVLSVVDADGKAIAIAANMAAHPTSIGDEDRYAISADYPGFFYAELEKLASEGCVALFFNGAEGNQTTGNPEGKGGWERTESIGRLLAIRAKSVANEITCGQAKLTLHHSTPELPKSLGTAFLPQSTLLYALEINDLLINFIPGEPCVEIGLELRRMALERGYAAQFTVGLANDHLMYFVPPHLYATGDYESAMNFYGPGISEFFYREFSQLMSKGEALPPRAPHSDTLLEPALLEGGLQHVKLSGTPYTMGFQRGRLYAEALNIQFEDRIKTPLDEGVLLPKGGFLGSFPDFLTSLPFALPVMGIGSRVSLSYIDEALFQELEGMADGAQLPFDAVWLGQNAHLYHERDDKASLFENALCTIFAALGDRAGADDLIVGRNLDWPREEAPVIFEMSPEEGRNYVVVGFPWSAGAFTGMNDAGLTVAIERIRGLGDPAPKLPAIELIVSGILQSKESIAGAAKVLEELEGLRGYHVLLAGMGKQGGEAMVLELGDTAVRRKAEDDLLFGVAPESATADEAAKTRYARAAAMLQEERIIGRKELQAMLSDASGGEDPLASIWNSSTRHSVICVPKTRMLYVAVPGEAGGPGNYHAIQLKEGGDDE